MVSNCNLTTMEAQRGEARFGLDLRATNCKRGVEPAKAGSGMLSVTGL